MPNLVQLLQFKKRGKHPWRSVSFSKLQASSCKFTKSNTLPWVFFTFFNLYKWYQIAQSIAYCYVEYVEDKEGFLASFLTRANRKLINVYVLVEKLLNYRFHYFYRFVTSVHFMKENAQTFLSFFIIF